MGIISKIKVCLFVSILLFCMSCASVKGSYKFILPRDNMIKLIELVNINNDSGIGFHIFYSEQFNDSTTTLFVFESCEKPLNTMPLLDKFKHNGNDVYVYKYDLDEASKRKESFLNLILWRPGGSCLNILAKKRCGYIQFKKISYFLNSKGSGMLDKMTDSLENKNMMF